MAALWTDEAKFQLWLEVEIAVLAALVQAGGAPASALENVRKKAKFSVERVLEIEREVKHDVIAFLTNVAEHVGEDSRFLHLGMTSSDLVDTAFSLQLVRSTDMILADVAELMTVTKKRALEHKDTICVGRSHGIHAEPTTFGLKLAGWYAELGRQNDRLKQARKEIAVGAVSGPVGTFAYLDPKIEAAVCRELGLTADPISTQIISRDRHAHLFLACAELAASVERIVLEVRHLQRTEVREAEEYFSAGQKGSSSMPHKRNPILSENVTGLSRLMRAWASAALENIPLWHERDISHSSVERVIASDIMITLDFMLARTKSIVEQLVVYPKNMQANLALTRGLVYSGALLVELSARGLSREAAYKLIQTHALATWDAIHSGSDTKTFFDRVSADEKITAYVPKEELKQMLQPERYLKHVDTIFQRVFS